MGEVIKLGKTRKARSRAERRAKAAENRTRFGRTESERKLETARAEKADRDIAGHRRQTEPEE